MLHEVRTGPEYFKSVLHDLHVRYTDFLMRTVEEAVADGEIPADTDAELLRSMVYGTIEHRMWGTLFGRGSVDVEVTADRFTRMIVEPLLPPSRPAVQSSAVVAADPRVFIDDLRVRIAGFEHALTETSREPAKARARRGSHRKARP